MKCQILFSGEKYEKNIISLASAEFAKGLRRLKFDFDLFFYRVVNI